jgi:hypothetical protein
MVYKLLTPDHPLDASVTQSNPPYYPPTEGARQPLAGGCPLLVGGRSTKRRSGISKRSIYENPTTVRAQSRKRGQKEAKNPQKEAKKDPEKRAFTVFQVADSYLQRIFVGDGLTIVC